MVVETGTAAGDSSLFMASMLDLLAAGRVITIDVDPRPGRPEQPRIEYVAGPSTDPAVSSSVLISILGAARVMIILDSDHTPEHVAAELEIYAHRVTPGCYLIVEDTNLNGNPVRPDFGPGPLEAAQAFLADHPAEQSLRSTGRVIGC